MIITNYDYVDEIKKFSPEIPLENIIAEPEKKNTALAMGVAAAYAFKKDPEAVVVNRAADHLIKNRQLLNKTFRVAAEVASRGKEIISVGIKPAFAHTGLGYIHAGKKLEEIDGINVYQAKGFKEKPDKATAEKFLKTGEYYWNANLYTWKASLILELFRELAPDLAKNIDKILQAIGTSKEKAVLKQEYHQAREDQIDTAISEKTKKLLVIRGDFDWCDVGDWKVVYQVGDKGQLGNMVIQARGSRPTRNVIFKDSRGNLVHYNDQLIALVGVEDLIVVDTDDALLVCRRDKAQAVKKVVQFLKKTNKNEYL